MAQKNSKKVNTANEEIAIRVTGIAKTFRIPHEKVTSLRGAAISMFRKRSYEEFNALDNVSFDVKKGEFFGVIGRNGSGKSTLLKILAGIYKPDKGNVRINGMISPFLELGIGFNPELSGRDNVYLNATVLGMSKKQIDEKFEDIVKFAELERFIDQKLKNYSSGMQVRLAFAVSIHANRDILLMDEVLAVGDSNFQKKCIDIFRGYRGRGKTVILVTHDIATVRKYCDRAMLLHNGKMIKIGNVNDVCDEYVIKNMSTGASLELLKKEKTKYDEENREKLLRAHLKNKPQIISDLSVHNENGEEILMTVRGQDFFVTVNLELKEIRENMHIAVQLVDKDTNNFISGNNTYADNHDCQWIIGKNTISIRFMNHQLNQGIFFVRAILFEHCEQGNTVLDEMTTLDNNYFFIVERKMSGGGVLYIDHIWKNEKIEQ